MHPLHLSRERTLTEKVSDTCNPDGRLFPRLRNYGESHPAVPKIKDGVGVVPLRKNFTFPRDDLICFSFVDRRQKM
jgi:hypothetical protein